LRHCFGFSNWPSFSCNTACIESFPFGRQFTQVIHLGLSSDCVPFSSSAAQDLAKSMVASAVMKSLGPYAQMASFATGGSCSFAQGYLSSDNLGGQGGVPMSGGGLQEGQSSA